MNTGNGFRAMNTRSPTSTPLCDLRRLQPTTLNRSPPTHGGVVVAPLLAALAFSGVRCASCLNSCNSASSTARASPSVAYCESSKIPKLVGMMSAIPHIELGDLPVRVEFLPHMRVLVEVTRVERATLAK